MIPAAREPRTQAETCARRRVAILGSTGSIGTSTLDLIARAPDRFEVVALAAGNNWRLLADQARHFRPRFVALADPTHARDLEAALKPLSIEVRIGDGAVDSVAECGAEWVMAAIVGAAGLRPTLAAVRRGAIVAFANKECLVCAGDLLLKEVSRHGARLLPVDSEHNAIFQVIDEERPEAIERLVLTASGGPFREATLAEMAVASPEQAVAHPRWSMGAKISVDCATMMNKGLEIIEAAYLFAMPEPRIDVLVHPESIVHSLVAYIDGSVLAQLGTPDMRTPISYALAWPERMLTPAARLDLAALGSLTFARPDPQRFPALNLARECLQHGGLAPTVLNAANEVAVAAFLERRIGFLDIVPIVRQTVEDVTGWAGQAPADLDGIAEVDQAGRRRAGELVAKRD
jgi:1-deoxy-D-xylulose-5-phosphate reductoisomerase